MSSTSTRRYVLAFIAASPLLAHAACSSGNGDPIPSPLLDASALDVGANPDDPDGGGMGKQDGATPMKDSSVVDSPADAPKDAPNTAPVQINELYVDTILDGDGSEFVELRSAPGTPADDLKLRLIGSDGLVRYEVSTGDPGDKFDANGLWVVGGMQTFRLNVQDRVDHPVGLATWGLDYPGAVQVVRGSTLLDVVGFTDDPDGGAVPPVPQAPTATVEGKPAILPDNSAATQFTKRISFGRKTGAADTNNNQADFCAMEASPGYPQKACK
jgi:hypothetical protein